MAKPQPPYRASWTTTIVAVCAELFEASQGLPEATDASGCQEQRPPVHTCCWYSWLAPRCTDAGRSGARKQQVLCVQDCTCPSPQRWEGSCTCSHMATMRLSVTSSGERREGLGFRVKGNDVPRSLGRSPGAQAASLQVPGHQGWAKVAAQLTSSPDVPGPCQAAGNQMAGEGWDFHCIIYDTYTGMYMIDKVINVLGFIPAPGPLAASQLQ